MELTTFDFKDTGIRIMEIEGEPWFVAKDVAEVLGYSQTDKAIRDHCRASEIYPAKMAGQVRHIKIIPERDVYRLIMKSKMPAAEAFEDWVVGTVLPAIRKDGGYIAGEEKLATGEMSEEEFVLRAMQVQQKKIDRLQKHFSNHLEYMSVDAFFALKHIYPAKGDSQSLGRRASLICARNGLEKRKHRRYAPSIEMMVELGEYPVAVLEEAFEDMINAGRIPRNLPQKELGLVH